MTQSPQKKYNDQGASLAKTKLDGSRVINSFEELMNALKSDGRFERFQIEYPQNHAISLVDADSTLIFIDSSVWRSQEQLETYREYSHSIGILIICVGKDDEFAQYGNILQTNDFHFLSLPLRYATLDLQIKGFLKTLIQIKTIDEDRVSAEKTHDHIKYILSISRELNGVRDIPKLLDLILTRAREVTGADAGSIYVVENKTGNIKEGNIVFKICQNSSVRQNLNEFRIPINDSSIVGNAVIRQKPINIPDLYLLKENDPIANPYNFKHDASWEKRIGYQCRSMLTIPMFDISYNVIGVIQLINKKRTVEIKLKSDDDFQLQVLPFDKASIEYAEIVAQQAGIALENALLTDEKEALFEGFVNASVKAIEQRDPTTSGHSHRVAKLTLSLAYAINRHDSGSYKNLIFTERELKELEYASLLHDFGKLGVREQVLVKAKKLYPWQTELIEQRFELIKARQLIDCLQAIIEFYESPENFPPGISLDQFKGKYENNAKELQDIWKFILQVNEPTVLEQGGFEKLKDIANLRFSDNQGHNKPYLRPPELTALSISRGSLTTEEFAEIQSHVTHTYEFLRKIPWGRELANVPHIAAKHHEKLDGSGYPNSATASEIPVQSRMMTIADIYDALTAADRPYKKSMSPEKALEIIEMEVKAGKCDHELFKIFVDAKCFLKTVK